MMNQMLDKFQKLWQIVNNFWVNFQGLEQSKEELHLAEADEFTTYLFLGKDVTHLSSRSLPNPFSWYTESSSVDWLRG